jgi:hypothetical protein
MTSLAHYMKLCVMATKENKMHIERENLSVLAKVTQVSDVAHGPLGFLLLFFFCFCFSLVFEFPPFFSFFFLYFYIVSVYIYLFLHYEE